MKGWQFCALGFAALGVFFLVYGLGLLSTAAVAILVLVAVGAGFSIRPKREVFRVQTKAYALGPGGQRQLQNTDMVVSLEVQRLWLLFIPTFSATAFLILLLTNRQLVDSAVAWLQAFSDLGYQPSALLLYGAIVSGYAVLGIVSRWMGERWMLYNAAATGAASLIRQGPHLNYHFKDSRQGYYGGTCSMMRKVPASPLSVVVLYREENPELNRLAIACVFHRLVVVEGTIHWGEEPALRESEAS